MFWKDKIWRVQAMMETNFSLLSQEEIDTLIAFLSEKSNFVESEVLSQDSIDKLACLVSFQRDTLIIIEGKGKPDSDARLFCF